MADRLRASATTVIDWGVIDVYERLLDVTDLAEWMDDIPELRLVDGRGGRLGAVYAFDYDHGGATVPMEVELTAVERPTRIELTGVDGPVAYERELRLSGNAATTRVTSTLETGTDGRFPGPTLAVAGPVLRLLRRRRLRRELDGLAERIEAEKARTEYG